MKQPLRLGLVCLARETFDLNAAAGLYEGIRKDAARIENITWETIPELVVTIENAKKAAARLAAAPLDGVVCVSGTFHLGHLVLEIRKQNPIPILLWGLDEPSYDGGKLRLNSVCGVNLDASNLYKAGVDDYRACIGPKIDETWIDALRAVSALKNAHVGIAGYRAQGFFNLGVADPELYGSTGILLDHYELSELHGQTASPEAVAARKSQLQDIFDVSGVSAAQVDKVAELSAKIDAFCDRNSLDALAVRCCPSSPGISESLPAPPCPCFSPRAVSSPARATWKARCPCSCIGPWAQRRPTYSTSPRWTWPRNSPSSGTAA